MSSANRIIRIHGPYVSEQEIEKITNCFKSSRRTRLYGGNYFTGNKESSLTPSEDISDEDELL